MGKKALLANTAIYRTFTISKVNLNLQFFYLIELWHCTKNWIYTNLLGVNMEQKSIVAVCYRALNLQMYTLLAVGPCTKK